MKENIGGRMLMKEQPERLIDEVKENLQSAGDSGAINKNDVEGNPAHSPTWHTMQLKVG